MSKTKNRGEENFNSKLTEPKVIEIKTLLARGWNHRDIATMYNISRQTVTAINNGERWGWLNEKSGQ